jgi:hypothetical protein
MTINYIYRGSDTAVVICIYALASLNEENPQYMAGDGAVIYVNMPVHFL